LELLSFQPGPQATPTKSSFATDTQIRHLSHGNPISNRLRGKSKRIRKILNCHQSFKELILPSTTVSANQ
jgi:hypothetical protein